MEQENYRFFQDHGYVSLGKILTDDELEYYTKIFEHDWSEAKDRCGIGIIIKRLTVMPLLVHQRLMVSFAIRR